jgi:hypothetical protein
MKLSLIIVTTAALLAACVSEAEQKEREEWRAKQEARRWQAVCVDKDGHQYYSQRAKAYYIDDGGIKVYKEDGKVDVVMGNCKLEEL